MGTESKIGVNGSWEKGENGKLFNGYRVSALQDKVLEIYNFMA